MELQQATPEANENLNETQDLENSEDNNTNSNESSDDNNIDDDSEPTEKQQDQFDLIKKSLPKGSELFIKDGKAYVKQKINGQVKTKTLDAIIRDYSKSEATDDLLHNAKIKEKELTQMRANIEAGMQKLLEDPRKYLELRRKAGFKEDDDYNFAYELLEEGVKKREMTPEQIKLQELEQYKKEMEAKEEEAKKTEAQKKFDAEVEVHRKDISDKCINALKKAGITEKTDKGTRQMFLSAMLHEMASAERHGFKSDEFTAEDAIERVKNSVKKFSDYYYTIIPENEIINSLPKRVIDVIRGKKTTETFDDIPTSNSLKKQSNKVVNYENKKPVSKKFNWSDWDKIYK